MELQWSILVSSAFSQSKNLTQKCPLIKSASRSGQYLKRVKFTGQSSLINVYMKDKYNCKHWGFSELKLGSETSFMMDRQNWSQRKLGSLADCLTLIRDCYWGWKFMLCSWTHIQLDKSSWYQDKYQSNDYINIRSFRVYVHVHTVKLHLVARLIQ